MMHFSPFPTLNTYVWLIILVTLEDVCIQVELIVYCHPAFWALEVIDVLADMPVEEPFSGKSSQAMGTLVLVCCKRDTIQLPFCANNKSGREHNYS